MSMLNTRHLHELITRLEEGARELRAGIAAAKDMLQERREEDTEEKLAIIHLIKKLTAVVEGERGVSGTSVRSRIGEEM